MALTDIKALIKRIVDGDEDDDYDDDNEDAEVNNDEEDDDNDDDDDDLCWFLIIFIFLQYIKNKEELDWRIDFKYLDSIYFIRYYSSKGCYFKC